MRITSITVHFEATDTEDAVENLPRDLIVDNFGVYGVRYPSDVKLTAWLLHALKHHPNLQYPTEK
jgi:hypothetical protein